MLMTRCSHIRQAHNEEPELTIAGTERGKAASTESREELDQALVSAAQAGSSAAFEALHMLYAQSIYRITFSFTKNTSDAEDAVQESFMRAFRGLKYFRKEAQFSSWLTRIAINSSLMVLKRRRKQRELSLEGHTEDASNIIAFTLVDSRPNPERFCHLKQTYGGIERSIEGLPKNLASVAKLGFLQGQSIQEISAVLGISNAATKSRLHRARKLMTVEGFKHRLSQRSA